MTALQEAIVSYQEEYNTKKLLSGNELTELPAKQYVDDISKALDAMFRLYYLSGRAKVNKILKKDLLKYDKKEAEKIKFVDIEDVIGKQFRPTEAINDLISQLELEEGNIYKTRLDTDLLVEKAKKIAILSYSDYVKRVNTKLLVAIEADQPYREFIRLIKADGISGLAVKDLVGVKGYWSTVYRTNLSTMFGAGFNDQRDEVKEFLAGEEYIAIVKDHPVCAAQSGERREVGGFAGTEEPNGYNCTGYRNPISKVAAKALNIKLTPKNKRTKVKADKGFQSSITANKVNKLPKTVENRLPSEYKSLM